MVLYVLSEIIFMLDFSKILLFLKSVKFYWIAEIWEWKFTVTLHWQELLFFFLSWESTNLYWYLQEHMNSHFHQNLYTNLVEIRKFLLTRNVEFSDEKCRILTEKNVNSRKLLCIDNRANLSTISIELANWNWAWQ